MIAEMNTNEKPKATRPAAWANNTREGRAALKRAAALRTAASKRSSAASVERDLTGEDPGADAGIGSAWPPNGISSWIACFITFAFLMLLITLCRRLPSGKKGGGCRSPLLIQMIHVLIRALISAETSSRRAYGRSLTGIKKALPMKSGRLTGARARMSVSSDKRCKDTTVFLNNKKKNAKQC